jgi:hypothetical protein
VPLDLGKVISAKRAVILWGAASAHTRGLWGSLARIESDVSSVPWDRLPAWQQARLVLAVDICRLFLRRVSVDIEAVEHG